MVGEWKPQNGQVHDEIDPRIPTDNKDFIRSNTGTMDDDDDVATADEAITGAGSASNTRKRGRHANRQIRELEAMFQHCPHPDESLRMALGEKVGMDPLRVKFWFQNRRNAKKNQNERQQNMVLRTENLMLAEENRAMKAAMLKKTCPTCKGPMVFIKPLAPPELLRLHMENERLKADLLRRTAYLHGVSAGTAGPCWQNCWLETFPDIVSSVSASNIGRGCICQGGVILLNAGLRVLSPGVSSCTVKFARQCQMIEQGIWAVVDVSLDAHGTSELRAWDTGLPGDCRVLPSGCLIKDMNNGYCKVAMIVNAEYDKGFMPAPLHPLLRSGHTFSARRWLTSLQRRCEFLAQRLSPAYGISRAGGAITPEGRNNVLELARRMTESFYAAISAPRGEAWRKIADWRGRDESFQLGMHVVTTLAAPGEQAAGPVLCATTTGRGRGRASCNKKLILQQACGDAPCMVVAYAPIDAGELKDVMHGGSRASLPLPPSGFAILPDGVGDMQIDPLDANPSAADPIDHQKNRGSLVSVLWQTRLIGGNLTAQTVDNVGNNVYGSIMKIKDAVHAKRVITV
ncbi:homeobox-leucine zipper protein ROC8-like [Triticum aestivum]|uniref:homeobox-leucine zipper protein ROC8-like n=1 Tax=Triticum aestivum TaxID=4565 RepID=UPI001D01719D|nr:homeobox-leucine zipper protein ROC8-like [Triticum aestivum]